jgi:hypothetical protein
MTEPTPCTVTLSDGSEWTWRLPLTQFTASDPRKIADVLDQAPSPSEPEQERAERIETLADRVRDGIAADDRQSTHDYEEACQAVTELASLALSPPSVRDAVREPLTVRFRELLDHPGVEAMVATLHRVESRGGTHFSRSVAVLVLAFVRELQRIKESESDPPVSAAPSEENT